MKKITKKKKTLQNNLKTEFPKYTASLMNLSNSTGNLTSKKNIGPLHEYFEEFKSSYKGAMYTIEEWEKFYKYKKGGKKLLEKAVEKNLDNIKKFREALDLIDKKLITDYISDLVYKKTFIGMNYEYLAVAMLAKEMKINAVNIKKSSSKEESQGIDYWIENVPVQVKPADSYKANKINIIKKGVVIYYKKEDQDEFSITFNEAQLESIKNGEQNENNS